jgi:tetratricopeptide (TPR) repeat protein
MGNFNLALNIDTSNPVVQLCMQGTRAEFQHDIDQARAYYQQAWDARGNDYDACIAAHYLARVQKTPEDTLHWNQAALNHADAVMDDSVKQFYPSLYLNMGSSYEALEDTVNAEKFYSLAAELGVVHQAR